MNYILIIKGVNEPDYQSIREDLTKQYTAKGLEVPLFAYLPQDYAEIEVLWIDKEMEQNNFNQALESSFEFERDYKIMRMTNA